MNGMGQRTPADGIGCKDRRAFCSERVTRTVEYRQALVAMQEEAKHRKHAIDCGLQAGWKFHAAFLTSQSQGKENEQKPHQFGGISRDVSSIRKYPAVQHFR